jgi:L-ascorbate metabolism protein UlaG (beta-lactamase superfamily)
MPVVSRDDERLTWVGHATVLLELGGARLLTDPLLRTRLAHLRRHGARPDPGVTEDIDAVLISHVHLDHLDVRSLRSVARRARVIGPEGAGRLLRRVGFARVDEVVPGDRITVGEATITALPAVHDGRRLPLGAPVGTLG